MNDVGTLSLNGCDVTNKDITITYVPREFVISYQYIIYKDDIEYNLVTVPNNLSTDIKLTETGNYKIKIIAYNQTSYLTFETNVYKIDKESPVIEVNEDDITISIGDNLDVYSNVKVTDNYDGDITQNLKSNVNEINTNSFGKKKLIYEVSDTAGNIATKELEVNISYSNYLLNLNQIIVISIIMALLLILFLVYRSVKLEKRIASYAVRPIKDHTYSILDNLSVKIKEITYRISSYIDRFDSINKLSYKYQKYADAFGNGTYNGIDFISRKIIVSLTFLVTSIIIQTLRFRILNMYELLIPLIVGFYMLDIIYAYRYYKYRKRIEKDLLQAIIIMNNSFKSGRSITQAIELVADQMEGAIADEFKKMTLEISFGLDIEEVFKRFAERIKLEEAAYLTSSLSVLNKTGGNIIEVFTSIEKTIFNRQKLNLELKSLTSSSKIIMYVLTIMPIIFVILINFINKDYFKPLFQNGLGFIIIGIILTLYICYIIVVRKIMKVRM